MTKDRRLRGAILVLSSLGAAIAAYLTYAHFAHVPVACATSGCETVQTSRYAEVGGVPVAAFGLAGYLVLAATAASGAELVRALGLAAAVGGLVFAAYLLYVQAALIGAFCQWCLASDVVLLLLVGATSLRLRSD
jgi:uncharacterized membrane protein